MDWGAWWDWHLMEFIVSMTIIGVVMGLVWVATELNNRWQERQRRKWDEER